MKVMLNYAGLQVNVKPEVRTVGVQCSMTQMYSSIQDIGIQCSLMVPVRPPVSEVLPYASSRLPSDTSQYESVMSQCHYESPDLDTSAYALQDDTSS